MALPEDNGWMKTAEAAKSIGISTATLNSMRTQGNGPEYIKLGHAVWYEPEAIKKWVEGLRRTQTAQKMRGVPKPRRPKAA